MRKSLAMIPLLLILSLTTTKAPAFGQSNSEALATIQFNFSTPGARSLGLGGAFLGLADDATAAYTNPAGLTVLSKPEISIEGRAWEFDTSFTDGGRRFGAPTGEGIDTVSGLIEGEESSHTRGISFLSVVYPRERWAFAFYRHELANFETRFRTQGAFLDLLEGPGASFRLRPVEAETDLEITNFGVSVGYRVNDRLSLGFGLSLYDFALEASTLRFGVPNDAFFERFADYSQAAALNLQTQLGKDEDPGATIGFLWRIDERWSLGGVYRQGPDFEFESLSFEKTAVGDDGELVCIASNPLCLSALTTGTFSVPDAAGLGLAFRPTDRLLLALDVDYLRYSDLAGNAIDVASGGLAVPQGAPGELTIDDVFEVHLGAEYVFPDLEYPLALRAGAWLDPDHRQRYEGPTDAANARFLATQFPGGDDEVHVSGGMGLVLSERFQVDAALDVADSVVTGSVSAVLRF